LAAIPILAALRFLAALKGQEFLIHRASLVLGWRGAYRDEKHKGLAHKMLIENTSLKIFTLYIMHNIK
jgi:hypothetical protein